MRYSCVYDISEMMEKKVSDSLSHLSSGPDKYIKDEDIIMILRIVKEKAFLFFWVLKRDSKRDSERYFSIGFLKVLNSS